MSPRERISAAADRLASAGVPTPRTDAELLAAHVAAVGRTEVGLLSVLDARFEGLVELRAQRIPLQHLTGVAPFGFLEFAVGPGVFVPRPETETLLEWALVAIADVESPLVVDACAGSGALALNIAHRRPDARVVAVELSEEAAPWLHHNALARADAGDTPVEVVIADVTAAATLVDLNGTVDLIVSNPPYVPVGSYVEAEAAEHDPALALWGGDDGLDLIRRLERRVAALLKPGGRFGFEHGEQQATVAAALLAAHGWADARGHADLSGRPRFTVGRRV